MSRGIGKTQQAILDALTDGKWHSPYELAIKVFGPATYDGSAPSNRRGHLLRESNTKAIRRAARALEQRGLVTIHQGTFTTARARMMPTGVDSVPFEQWGTAYDYTNMRVHGIVIAIRKEQQ